ncbi:MAG: hypothetical protein PUB34_00140 [Clostridia bacterium]|nr:hypothetical protein [Clostridia bacterium]
MKKINAFLGLSVVMLFAAVIIFNVSVIVSDARQYEKGARELEAGNYSEAVKTFEKLGKYRDSGILLDYAKFRSNFDIDSDSFVVCSYKTILRIDSEYKGTRFTSDIAGDRAMVADVYYSLADTINVNPQA